MLWLAVFFACLLTTTPASAFEFVAGAIGLTDLIAGALGAGAVAGLASAIGGTIVGIGVATAFTLGAKLFAPKTAAGVEAAQTPTGVQTSLSIGANVPRNAIVGPQATAGQLTYWNLYGDQNRYLQLVFTLGVGPHDALTGIIVNGTRVTVTGPIGPTGTPIPEFSKDSVDCLVVRFFNGFYDQSADSELVTNANPPGRWTSDNRGRGICYVSLTLDYFFPELWPQGIPQFLFELQGLRLYDRRRDSTEGGSGSHLWSDQHTWEYSDNPALALYLFERGLYVGSRKQLGRGLAPVDLISEFFVAAANVADEPVPLKAGGTEKRYRLGMNIGVDRDWSSVEHEFCIAMSGWIMESAGAYGPIAGAGQTSVVSITDDDLISGREVVYSQKRSRSELINTIFGTYTDPAQNWQMIPYPARASSADVTIDGAEFASQRDYPMLFSLPQVQRAGEIERRLGRQQATAEIVLGFRFSNIEQGDWITWTSARRNFTKKFQVTRIRVDDDDTISLSLREISLLVFSFDETTDELDPLNPGDLAGINALITSVPDFSVEAAQINGAGGLTIPGIRALWSPIFDQTVDEVYVEYRIVSTTDVVVSQTFTPSDGEGLITNGIQANTPYEARANLITTPIRGTFWTPWIAVTSPVQHVVPFALNYPSSLPDLIAAQVSAVFNEAQANLKKIVDFVASHSIELEAQNLLQQALTDKDVGQVVSDIRENFETADMTSSARAYIVGTAQASATEAIAAIGFDASAFLINDMGTSISASSDLLLAAQVNTDSAIATYDLSVTTTYGGISASVEQSATAITTLEGYAATSYSVRLDANSHAIEFQLVNGGAGTGVAAFAVDFFYIGKPTVTGGTSVPVWAVSTVGGTPKVVLRGDMYADGTIYAQHLTADVINASTLIADNVIIRGKMVADTATRMDVVTGSSNFTWDNTEQTIATLPVTTVGGTAYIEGTISAFSGLSIAALDCQPGDIALELYYDTALIETVIVAARIHAVSTTTNSGFQVLRTDIAGSWSITMAHSPLAGAHNYYLKMVSLQAPGYGPLSFDYTLVAFEARR